MKRTTRRKIKKAAKRVTEEILWLLKDLGQMVPYPFESKYQYTQRLKYYNRYQVSRGFWELNKGGFVKKIKQQKKTYYAITDLGRARLLKFSYRRKPKRSKTNGLSTIIIFDVPEEKRKARGFLRRFLIQNGFVMLQRSVFIGRWEMDPEFKDLLKELKIDQHVSIIEGRVLHD